MQLSEVADLSRQFLERVVGPGFFCEMEYGSCPEGTFIGQYESKEQLYNVAVRQSHDNRGTPYIAVHIQTAFSCEVHSGDWRIYGRAGNWDMARTPMHA